VFRLPGLYLVDLPGYGFARASKTARAGFRELLDGYVQHRDTLAGVVWLLDIRRELSAEDEVVRSLLADSGHPVLAVLTKIDKLGRVAIRERTLALAAELGLPPDELQPTSVVTGEGIAELLMVMIGLAQRYMEEDLALSVDVPGVGTVLEVKEERGLGTTLDVILYNGTLSVGDEVAIAKSDGVSQTKVRSLLKPRPMKEILIEDRFERVKSVAAAAGIKVSAPNLEGVIAGSPIRVIRGDAELVKEEIRREMEEIKVKLSPEGLLIKADTIGALEAICNELEVKEIGVMRAEVGPVSRHDLVEAETIKKETYRVLLAFNSPLLPDAVDMVRDPAFPVKVFEGRVIYKLIDDYVTWKDDLQRTAEKKRFEQVIMPAKIRILPDCIFRQSNPAVVGVRVLAGTLRADVNLIRRDAKKVGHLKTMQLNQETIREAQAGAEVAISIEGATVGRQFEVGDDLLVDIPERHVKVLEREMMKNLNVSTQEALGEFTDMKRRGDPFWGK